MRELSREAGATTVVVSHDPQSAPVADRVVQIRDGRVSAESRGGAPAEAVINRGGWIRIPEELAGEATHARLEPAPDGVLVHVPKRAAREVTSAKAAPDGAVVARTDALSKTHGTGARATRVFDGLSAEFRAGRLSVVTGPSGSGKSTLLHLLAGLDLPDSGDVLVLDRPFGSARRDGRAELRRSSIGLVTQGTDLVPFLTAHESVALALAIRGVPRGEARSRAERSLADVGLAELAGQRVSHLSMGSANASLLLGPSPPGRHSCLPTSRRLGSTRRTRARWVRCPQSSRPRPPRRSCARRTIRC